jgi:hypothetical protein
MGIILSKGRTSSALFFLKGLGLKGLDEFLMGCNEN